MRMGRCVRILMLNVAWQNNIIKQQRISKLLRAERVEIVCLQEMHIKKGEEKHLKKVFPGIIYHASAEKSFKGVMIMFAPHAKLEGNKEGGR